jgi:hypothetical protein
MPSVDFIKMQMCYSTAVFLCTALQLSRQATAAKFKFGPRILYITYELSLNPFLYPQIEIVSLA